MSAKSRAAGGKSARRRARELAMQGLYEWLVGRAELSAIDAHMREQEGFERCDSQHFDALLHGCARESAALDAVLGKTFGGTDGHKYVNGVLDKAALELRPQEVAAARAARA